MEVLVDAVLVGKAYYQSVQEGPPLVVTESLVLALLDLKGCFPLLETLFVMAPLELNSQWVHVG